MDDFVSIFGKSVREMGSSPILLMAGLAVGVLSLPVLAGYGKFDEITKSIAVNYSQLVLPLLVMPFITGGALGYAVEVRNKGASSLATFIDAAVKNYVKMVMAGVISFTVFYFLITGVALLLLTGVAASPFMGSILGFLALGLAFLLPALHRVLRRGDSRRWLRGHRLFQEQHRLRQAQPASGRGVLHNCGRPEGARAASSLIRPGGGDDGERELYGPDGGECLYERHGGPEPGARHAGHGRIAHRGRLSNPNPGVRVLLPGPL